MMKTLVTVGAFVVAGLALSGSAAATCENGSLGLSTYDYYNVCVLESYSYSSPLYSYSWNSPVSASYYSWDGSGQSGAGANVYQYRSEYCWSQPCEVNTGTGADVYYYEYNWNSGQYQNTGAYVYQYSLDTSWYDYETTGAGVYNYDNSGSTALYYYQWTAYGTCTEQAYAYSPSYTPLINSQPCTVEVPMAPTLPSL